MRPPRLDRVTVERVLGKMRRMGSSKRSWDRDLNRWLLRKQLAPLFQQSAPPTLALTTIPIVADVMEDLPVDRWVYYCVDDFSHWPGLDQATMLTMEEQVVRRADLLIAASSVLQVRLGGMGREASLCTHGVNLEVWKGGGAAKFTWPSFIQGPVALFWGVVDRRLDTDFLVQLASSLPELSIVLVGPVQSPDPAIQQLPNVHSLAAVTTEVLARMAQAADCLIMPYAKNPLTLAMQPLKLKEYLASGRPAVVRRLPSTESWALACDVVDNAAEFVKAVQRRIDFGISPEQANSRRLLERESWSRKAEEFQALVQAAGTAGGLEGEVDSPARRVPLARQQDNGMFRHGR
jgi:hypothetical protein